MVTWHKSDSRSEVKLENRVGYTPAPGPGKRSLPPPISGTGGTKKLYTNQIQRNENVSSGKNRKKFNAHTFVNLK